MVAAVENGGGPRSKRSAILRAAVECFGDVGYEHTKWSEVADRVGIGQTALYHYFESKAHCLLTIMHMRLQESLDRFKEVSAGLPPVDALRAGVASAYDANDFEVLQTRILHSHIDLLATPRASEREEEERQASRVLVREIERAWISVIERGMADGSLVPRDARTMGRAALGLIISVWDWYRPGGPMTLPQVTQFIEGCILRMLGPDPVGSQASVSAPSSRRPRKARSRS